MPSLDQLRQVEIQSLIEWRRWLEHHWAETASVWVVSYRKHVVERHVPTPDLVDEALCFGWIDSRPRALDADRTMLLFSPRKPGSAWSKVNKEKIERLITEGRMAEPGLAKIESAKADGSWERIDQAGQLTEPDDLSAAFDLDPVAFGHWQAFPPSTRRAILEWILQARTEATRSKRVAETVTKAQVNERANQWVKKG